MKSISIAFMGSRFLATAYLSLCSLSVLHAEPLKVVVIAPESGFTSTAFDLETQEWYPEENEDFPVTNHDIDQVQAHLQGLLDGAAEYVGSEVTVLKDAYSLICLHNASYSSNAGYEDNELLKANVYDVAILVTDPKALMLMPSFAFEGVSQLTKRLLKKGTEVYLMEPEHDPVKWSAKEAVHRIANGCGINVISAGETLRQASLYNTSDSSEAYIMSGSIFSTVTGLGVSTGSDYLPAEISLSNAEQSDLEDVVLDTIASEKVAEQYTTSFNEQGGIIHRPLDITAAPFNGVVKVARVGTSTERQIANSMMAIIDDLYLAGGETVVEHDIYELTSSSKSITALFNTDEQLLDTTTEDQYVIAYGRYQGVSLDTLIESNQANLLALPYSRHSSGSSSYDQGLYSWYLWKAYHMFNIHRYNGNSIPSFSINARNRDAYPDSVFLFDETHQTTENVNGIAAAYLTSAMGIDFDNDELNRLKYYRENDPYFIGWNTIMQQAHLSEDRAFTPDANLDVVTEALPNASAASPLDISLSASGGTAPFTWEEITGDLPVGVSLQSDGQLQGNALGDGGSYNLVFKVTDANGAFRKKALQLTTTGYGVDTASYGWDSHYYFDTAETPRLIEGTVITALNGGSSDVTVDGVTFTSHDLGGGAKSAYAGSITSTGDTGYDGLLSSLSEGTSNEEVVSLSGLVAGEAYTLQVFYNNKADTDGYQSQLHAEIDGIGEVILKANHSSSASDDYGSYGVANFIASGSEVKLTLKARSDTHSIKGTVAFNGLLLTKPSAITSHEGVSRHAEIEWTTPTSVTGLDDVIEGMPIYALNGGSDDITLDSLGVTFTGTDIGQTSNVTTDATSALSDADFALLMSSQSVTDYFHTFTFENLTVGREYQIQVFNKSTPLANYASLNNAGYLGSDTYFGLPGQGLAYVFSDGEVMQSVGTFTATSTSQVLEMYANEENMIKNISFSALYVVEVPGQDGLLAYWSMDDGAGSVVTDDTGNGHDGTLTGGAWESSGRVSGAVCFDSDGSIEIPAAAFDSVDTAFTIMMWAYGGDDQPQNDALFRVEDVSGNRIFNIHLPWSSSIVYWDAGGESGYNRVVKSASTEEIQGRWNHWAFTIDTSTGVMEIYLNGELWHSGTGKTRSLGSVDVAFLASGNGNLNYSGCIDEVSIYSSALNAIDVWRAYESYDGLPEYRRWLIENIDVEDDDVMADSDNDGVVNILEYALGGDPNIKDANILPSVVKDGSGYMFSFERNVDSSVDTTLMFQYSSNLLENQWTDVAMSASEVTLGAEVDGVQAVDIMIDDTEAVDEKLFGRIKVLYDE